jgi:hypothetical protein
MRFLARTLPPLAMAVTACLALGCKNDSSAANDAALPPDASCGEAIDCVQWLQDYEREVVSKLSGHTAIADNLTITSRFTVAERDATRDYLFAELVKNGLQAERHTYGTGTNVFARLAATTPAAGSSLILLGSHFDGIENSPAAGDDGTGVALVLTAARYFANLETRPNEMIFAFFDEEEDGLIGSQAFAEKLRQEDPDLAAAHLFDLISWDEDADGAVELWSPSTELEALYKSVGEELSVKIEVVDFDSSDHASFIGSGFSSVGVSEEFVSGDNNPYYHTPDDTYENIDFDYLERVTRFSLTVASRAQ